MFRLLVLLQKTRDRGTGIEVCSLNNPEIKGIMLNIQVQYSFPMHMHIRSYMQVLSKYYSSTSFVNHHPNISLFLL
jgi:hypothetical protein